MKTPEKIFICNYGSDVSYEWHSESEFEAKSDNDIEYIRTDVFIEKACKWLKENGRDYATYDDSKIMPSMRADVNIKRLVKDFCKAMEK